MTRQLLASDELPPVLSVRRGGRSPFVIIVDHAGRRIPRSLDSLGLSAIDRERHIAWDIGALGVALAISERLDAALVAQNYSRLVIDCNRRPGTESSIPTVSEATEIRGNMDLAPEEVESRRKEIFEPYHAAIRAMLDERVSAGRLTIIVSQHSMTDVFKGDRRQMHAAVLYDRDARVARAVLEELRREPDLRIAENEPYRCNESTDYSIFSHAQGRGIAYVELEIRQDLIRTTQGQAEWGLRVADALARVESRIGAILRS